MKLIPQSSLMVFAELHSAIIIRTTRAGPATILAPVGEMSVGTCYKSSGPGEVPQAFLADSITINSLGPTQQS